MKNSIISDKVFETIRKKQCIDINDIVTPLDFWVCILAFTFDINFEVTYRIVKENNYIDILINRFCYSDSITRERMKIIRNIINEFINEKIV